MPYAKRAEIERKYNKPLRQVLIEQRNANPRTPVGDLARLLDLSTAGYNKLLREENLRTVYCLVERDPVHTIQESAQ